MRRSGAPRHGVACGLALALALWCAAATSVQQADPIQAMNRHAESYVKLVLAVGQHEPGYVDAFYGPVEWREEAARTKTPLAALRERGEAVVADLQAIAVPKGDELVRLRQGYLVRQLQALVGRVRMLGGEKFAFDEESKLLYDAVAPVHPETHFQKIVESLEKEFPGEGPLVARYEQFKRAFVVPRDRLGAVFSAAISACRHRTLQHLDLPAEESFTVEYVTNKSWSGYNWYQGGFRSLIQVNTDLPVYIDRAVDLACHEGYPGHHVYNVLLERHLVRERGWIEFTVYPLFSPQSLIAEGTANFGIDVAFPGDERVEFEKTALFPLAGLDPARAETYARVMRLVHQLDYAGNEAARRYLNGEIDAKAAADWLERYALMPRARAEQRVRFFDQYRSYVINYNLGRDMVRRYIESKGGTASRPDRRWQEFERLLSSPRLPSGLVP
jgi:hypothetical protein